MTLPVSEPGALQGPTARHARGGFLATLGAGIDHDTRDRDVPLDGDRDRQILFGIGVPL